MLSEGYEENLNNEITDDVKTKNSTSPLQRNSESPSTSPRQLTTPLPSGRSIERRLGKKSSREVLFVKPFIFDYCFMLNFPFS